MVFSYLRSCLWFALFSILISLADSFTPNQHPCSGSTSAVHTRDKSRTALCADRSDIDNAKKKHVVIIGAGWGGLSAAQALSQDDDFDVTILDAAPRVGGLVRDGYMSLNGTRPVEAGQHGFWNNYHNIYRLIKEELHLDMDQALTDYAEQGQYSPHGLEAIWPIYGQQTPALPTGLAQAAYTRFLNLPLLDRISAFPLVLAFSEFDGSKPEAWEHYDAVSFRDLCIKLGVSRRCYEEAFEPMILTGLFAPGDQCSAAAALGMAYFFVLQSQAAFDVRWCRGNIGQVIFDPWVQSLQDAGVSIETDTRVTGFGVQQNAISQVRCQTGENKRIVDADNVVLAVGAIALNNFVRFCPELGAYPEFGRFANLRGTSVLATRIFLDRTIEIPYSANACWGFDRGVGMTVFDVSTIHGLTNEVGSVIEVDFYHASTLLVLNDKAIVEKVKQDLDTMFSDCSSASVVDAAVVRLPSGVNWYYPGSYADMPDVKSKSLRNLYFCGDIVRTQHGSWSQEKAFVTGMEAANLIRGQPIDKGIIPVGDDEFHVAMGRQLVSLARSALGRGKESNGPSLVDFLW